MSAELDGGGRDHGRPSPPSPPPPWAAVRVRILDRAPPVGGARRRDAAETAAVASASTAADAPAGRGERRSGGRKKRGSGRRRCRRDDEHATAYVTAGDVSALGSAWSSASSRGGDVPADGTPCRLVREIGRDGAPSAFGGDDSDDCSRRGRRSLWVPVILRTLPRRCDDGPENDGDGTSKTTTRDDNSNRSPELRVPPCLAAALGLHGFRTNSPSALAYLQPLPAKYIVKASHATLMEVGRPPPVADLKWPPERKADESENQKGSSKGTSKQNDQAASNDEEEPMGPSAREEQLRRFFLYPPRRQPDDDDGEDHVHPKFRKRKPVQSKPRQRLLAPGSIFAVPSFDGRDDRGGGTAAKDIENVRFYRVVDAQSAREEGGAPPPPATSVGEGRIADPAYVVSPSTRLALLPAGRSDDAKLHPQLEGVPTTAAAGRSWRMPRPSLAASFLRSVAENVANDDSVHEKAAPNDAKESKSAAGGIRHPSAGDLADALYLQGAVPARPPPTGRCNVCRGASRNAAFASDPPSAGGDLRIVHVVGKEENHVRACVDEAADIS